MPGLADIPDDSVEPPEGDGEPRAPEDPPAADPKHAQPKSKDNDGPKFHRETPEFDGDRVLSNAILFLMEFGWWIELNYAIPEGDLMNLAGEIGRWIEADLMKEHNNRWLEDMVKRRGGNFDDKFYRKTVAQNVRNFLKIKEDVESAFELKRRSKSHTSSHFRDETKHGHTAVNRFDRGYQRLEAGKLQEFLERSAEYATVLHDMEKIRNGDDGTQAMNVDRNIEIAAPGLVESDVESASRTSSGRGSPQSSPSSRPPSSMHSARSTASTASRLAADSVEQWDNVDHSDEDLFSGSDLAVSVDAEMGIMSVDWYEEDEFESVLERLCGPEADLESDSDEDEEVESEDPDSESEGE
ncbi:hypothetical protein B0H13DRAFT_1853442 [Mycena leptocephala]|nr:hypothetical protein B0H13DRAFT_1853442 [Mycena leptocephala]